MIIFYYIYICISSILIVSGYEASRMTQISYTPNGTDPNEIHLVADTINVRYFKNQDLFKDNDGLVKYQEVDVTSWLWPNYISELQTCSPNLPEFILEDMQTIKLSETYPTNITFIAFEQCRDAKFLFRIWDRIPLNNVTWDTPLWISINETLRSFAIDTSKVTSVGLIKLIFQSQLIGFSFSDYYLNNTISTYTSNFRFTNENWNLKSSLSDWYVIIQQTSNFTIAFDDKENDRVLMSLVNSRAWNAFIQTQNASAFNLMVMWDDISVSQTTVTLKYTDKYHQESQYWIQINISLNIFKSQPPVFANQLNQIQINLWESSQLIFKLPEIIDVDSNLFNVSLISSAPIWIHIQRLSNEFQNSSDNFYVNADFLY